MNHNKGYQKWRNQFITPQIAGTVVELGVTVENLPLHAANRISGLEQDDDDMDSYTAFQLILVDSQRDRLEEAKESAAPHKLVGNVHCCHATDFRKPLPIPQNAADWVVSTTASWSTESGGGKLAMLGQINRCLKPGGHFRILDIVKSRNLITRLGQKLTNYGKKKRKKGDYDDDVGINILRYLKGHPDLSLDRVEYVHGDTHLLIQGHKRTHKKKSKRSLALSDISIDF